LDATSHEIGAMIGEAAVKKIAAPRITANATGDEISKRHAEQRRAPAAADSNLAFAGAMESKLNRTVSGVAFASSRDCPWAMPSPPCAHFLHKIARNKRSFGFAEIVRGCNA
jgi:hypothetical protein